ncbi:MAG TPA: hypothetical protein VLH10_21510 [Yinghuangia sp.]|nr:hypothetical protein [Yinghuangia sp.]
MRSALEAFLGDDEQGMFRGPFLRIRTPFARADDGWRELLEWVPPGFSPYAHQALAFERLSSLGGRTPQGTLVTTGTGSGKTESFLSFCRSWTTACVRNVRVGSASKPCCSTR